MPRKSRIDAPGALHHIMARGTERRKVFLNDSDRDDFLDRLGNIIEETETRCYAWALIPNHFHLLLKTGLVPIATVMRRLLTGYAISYNRRHHRRGHLFQDRYKSVLCQEDPYFLELVRYIHVNPLRVGLVEDLKGLDKFLYAGHSVIMGKRSNDWQDVDGVLGLFGAKVSLARRRYRAYVKKGATEGKREDLTGGGLIRSYGGWSNVKAMRKANISQKGDERILGDSAFVENVLSSAQEQMDRKYALYAKGVELDKIVQIVAGLINIEPAMVFAPGKERSRVQARSLLCYWSVRELGISMTELSRQLKISVPAVSFSVKRGEQIAMENNFTLTDLLKV